MRSKSGAEGAEGPGGRGGGDLPPIGERQEGSGLEMVA